MNGKSIKKGVNGETEELLLSVFFRDPGVLKLRYLFIVVVVILFNSHC